MPKKVDQSSPIPRKSGLKSKLWPPKSRPPKGFGGKFWHGRIGSLWAYLTFKIGGPPIYPQFLGIFFFKMLILTLKISKSKLWPPKSRPPKGFGSKFWHGSLWAYLTFKIGGPPHLPAIFGDFFFQNVNFDPKNLKIVSFYFRSVFAQK